MVSRPRVGTKRRETSAPSYSPRFTWAISLPLLSAADGRIGSRHTSRLASIERHQCRERDTQPCSGTRIDMSNVALGNGAGNARSSSVCGVLYVDSPARPSPALYVYRHGSSDRHSGRIVDFDDTDGRVSLYQHPGGRRDLVVFGHESG